MTLGEKFQQTAKSSGAPRWAAGDVAGIHQLLTRYLRPDISAIHQRPGDEIAVARLFAFTRYADKNSNNDLAVEAATRQFSSNAASSHDGQ